MKRLYVVLATALLVAGLAAASLAAVNEPVPPCCDVPAADSCLVRFHKRALGAREAGGGHFYRCGKDSTWRSPMRITLRLTHESLCDEFGFLPDNSVLSATGVFIRRTDGFAHFTGSFRISAPGGTVLFSGSLELMDRLGSHHGSISSVKEAPCEACDQRGHLEGWLMGCGAGKLAPARLQANVVGALSPSGAAAAKLAASFDGAVLRSP